MTKLENRQEAPFAVLIHWKIKNTPKDITAFFKFWNEQANIVNRAGLIGEFLSKPVDQESIPLTQGLNLSPSSNQDYVSFVNVGFWRSPKDFMSEVGKYMKPPYTLQSFEAYPRERFPLLPQFWRVGEAGLPKKDHLTELPL